MQVKEIGGRKKGCRPESVRLVYGEGLSIAKRANEATLCKTLFTIIVTDLLCGSTLG